MYIKMSYNFQRRVFLMRSWPVGQYGHGARGLCHVALLPHNLLCKSGEVCRQCEAADPCSG